MKDASLTIIAAMLDGATFEEGEALARAIIDHYRGRGPRVTLAVTRGDRSWHSPFSTWTPGMQTMRAACGLKAHLSAANYRG